MVRLCTALSPRTFPGWQADHAVFFCVLYIVLFVISSGMANASEVMV
jgi:hypothetical protein